MTQLNDTLFWVYLVVTVINAVLLGYTLGSQ